jgi:hypothetical protein
MLQRLPVNQLAKGLGLPAVDVSGPLVDAASAEQASGRTLADGDLPADALFPTSHAKVFVQHVWQVTERRSVNVYWHICGEHRNGLGGFVTQADAERSRCPECAAHEEALTCGWKNGYRLFLGLRLVAGSR